MKKELQIFNNKEFGDIRKSRKMANRYGLKIAEYGEYVWDLRDMLF